METQEIEITIQPDGGVKLHVRGAAGPQCLVLTADLEKLLGGQITAREKTPDYDQPVEQSEAAWQTTGQPKHGHGLSLPVFARHAWRVQHRQAVAMPAAFHP